MSVFRKIITAVFCIWMSLGQAQAAVVQKVRLGGHPDKVRVVLDLSEHSEFKSYVATDNPFQVVVELPEGSWSASGQRGVDFIRGYTHQVLPGGTIRLVFDGTAPLKIEKSFRLAAANGKADRIVLDLKALESPAAQPAVVMTPAPISVKPMITPQIKPAAVPKPLPKPVVSKKIIVIDAGHGGNDPGAVGTNGVREKHITLKMARILKKHLERTGRYKVVLTRNSDKYLRLYKRVNVARRADADLFISLHADSIGHGSVRGASIYTLSEKASDKESEWLASRENRADEIGGVNLSDEADEVASILIDLAMRETMNESMMFAGLLTKSMRAGNIQMVQNPQRSAGFAVLKAPDVPSVLVELGYLSNSKDTQLLQSSAHQDKVARSIVIGVDRYFQKLQALNR